MDETNKGQQLLGDFIRRIEYDINTQVLNTKDLALSYILANTDLKLEAGGSL